MQMVLNVLHVIRLLLKTASIRWLPDNAFLLLPVMAYWKNHTCGKIVLGWFIFLFQFHWYYRGQKPSKERMKYVAISYAGIKSGCATVNKNGKY